MAQFASYEPVTTVAVSLTITAPTGLYNSGRILNLGSNRWSFKPEIAVSHPFGPEHKWELTATPTPISIPITILIMGWKASGNTHYPGSKDTSATPSPPASGLLSIRAIPSSAIPSSTARTRTTCNRISFLEVS